MDQTIGTARDTAACARRIVLRTLTVVGGAAAATALAWLLSSTAASADTADGPANSPTDTVPSIAETQVVRAIAAPEAEALDDALAPALRPVTDRVSAMPAPRPPLAVEELGERVTRTAGEFGEHAHEQLPECADSAASLCGLEHLGSEAPVAADGAGLGRSDSPSPAPAAVPPAGAGKVATSGVDPDHTAERTATGRAYSDGMPRRGSPAPGMPSIPDFPAPLAPATPGPAHTGSAGNPADSSLFAALPWQDRMPALVRGLTVPATEVTTVGRVGAQPGVAPD